MKGLRTKLRYLRFLIARSRLREADEILEEIDRELDLDHQHKQEKKDARHSRINRALPAEPNRWDEGD